MSIQRETMSYVSVLNRYRKHIDGELKSIIIVRDLPLYRMMAYHMGWLDDQGETIEMEIGTRTHATLCAITCEAMGGDIKKALPAAAALELIENFSQIHRDIQEGSPERHHRPTVWWVWGPAQGINAGDAMHALARLSLLRQTENIISPEQALTAVAKLDTACLKVCEGQYLDLMYQERVDISQSAYFEMVECKTAALMSCATELGALMSSADERTTKAIALYGRKLGMALQIREDILDLWGSEKREPSPSGDILNKKKSLPIIYAIENAVGAERRTLGDVYFKRVMEIEDLVKLIEVLDRLGAKKFSEETADAFYHEAIQAIDGVSISSEGFDELSNFARLLVMSNY